MKSTESDIGRAASSRRRVPTWNTMPKDADFDRNRGSPTGTPDRNRILTNERFQKTDICVRFVVSPSSATPTVRHSRHFRKKVSWTRYCYQKCPLCNTTDISENRFLEIDSPQKWPLFNTVGISPSPYRKCLFCTNNRNFGEVFFFFF